jgi:hypothetical protein
MCTICVTSDIAFRTFSSVLPAQGKHVPAMTTPIGTNVRQGLKSVRDAVIDLLFVSVLLPKR